MIIKTEYSIGDKVELYSYDEDDQVCTITSLTIRMSNNDKYFEIIYGYIRKESETTGFYETEEKIIGKNKKKKLTSKNNALSRKNATLSDENTELRRLLQQAGIKI